MSILNVRQKHCSMILMVLPSIGFLEMDMNTKILGGWTKPCFQLLIKMNNLTPFSQQGTLKVKNERKYGRRNGVRNSCENNTMVSGLETAIGYLILLTKI